MVSLVASIISGVSSKMEGRFSKLPIPSVLIKVGVSKPSSPFPCIKRENLNVHKIWEGSAAVCDMMIAIYMTYYVRAHSLQPGPTA